MNMCKQTTTSLQSCSCNFSWAPQAHTHVLSSYKHVYCTHVMYGISSYGRYSSERRKAKILNFSIAYGKTAHGLAKDFNTTVEEAKETVEKCVMRL
jgi:DNA polymerase I-like protein with 3'-5' exonuclease and polymerase domains